MSWQEILKAPLTPYEEKTVDEFFSEEVKESAKMIGEDIKIDNMHQVGHYLHTVMVKIIKSLTPYIHPKLKDKTTMVGLTEVELKSELGDFAKNLGTSHSFQMYPDKDKYRPKLGVSRNPRHVQPRMENIRIPSLGELLGKMEDEGLIELKRTNSVEEAWDKFEEFAVSEEFQNAPRYVEDNKVYLEDSEIQDQFDMLLYQALQTEKAGFDRDLDKYVASEGVTIAEKDKMMNVITHFIPEIPREPKVGDKNYSYKEGR